MGWEVRQGDCVELMRAMEPETFHAIVTDPPYLLGFMNKGWDKVNPRALDCDGLPGYRGHGRKPGQDSAIKRKNSIAGQDWHYAWAAESLRVCKPGAHLLAFGGTRTYHRLACAIEDAGWEIRDCLMWLYGSGFPKSLDVSKAIDKVAGAEREVIGERRQRANGVGSKVPMNASAGDTEPITVPATPEAQEWQGFGTALKPAYEPIILARKPLEGTVAQNVLKHGCGALDIDGSRIGTDDNLNGGAYSGDLRNRARRTNTDTEPGAVALSRLNRGLGEFEQPEGRFPANVLLDEVAGLGIGEEARFFYTSKASQDERPEVDGVQHPTVKPLDLMRYLVGLVSREGDLILDPFAGSGTTIAAAVALGRNCVGCELNPEYVKLIEKRMETVTGSLFA